MIDELAAVVGVEAEDTEREVVLKGFQSVEDAGLSTPPDGGEGGLPGGDINEVDGVDKASSHGGAAMGDGISLKEARS